MNSRILSLKRMGRAATRIGLLAASVGGVLSGAMGGVVWAQTDTSESAQSVRGAITVLVENVYVSQPGSSEETRAGRAAFDPGETLRTDATGAVLISWFYDGTETVLAQNSRLTLNRLELNEGVGVVEMTLQQGHLIAGVGHRISGESPGTFDITLPDAQVRLLEGHAEITVGAEGTSLIIVTFGRAEVRTGTGDPVTLVANEIFFGGEKSTVTTDGVTPGTNRALDALCFTTANTNLVVRMYPSENSQRLGGVPSGQVLWVRAATDGNLWLQIAYATDPLQTDLFNYGWVYGPATTLGENCDILPRVDLNAQLYGGRGLPDSASGQSEAEQATPAPGG